MTLRIEVPRKLKPLLAPRRYKGAYGGRGGAKSHFFAEQLILRCYWETTRGVCIREIQNSIKDSVKQLLTDKIKKLKLESSFEVLETEIRGPRGSLIVFKGMQSYNAANIKSLEGYDIAWVEEAQTLSQHSLDLLRPTLRKPGSELWFSWNPRYKTDPVDAFFRGKHAKDDPEIISVLVNWRDNPWFPAELKREKDRDYLIDEDKAEHIWEGAYGASQGAILAKWVNRAERQGRITEVRYDPDGPPVEISSDLGYRDTASWWFWQRCYGGYRLLSYMGESGLDADEWIPELQKHVQELGAPLGRVWLPHDAKAKTFATKHSSMEKFLEAFGADVVRVVPQTKKLDQISAARAVIQKCEFDEIRCEKGLDGLRAWEYEYNDELQVFSREPLHNWASHPSDAFAYGCQVMETTAPPESAQPAKFLVTGHKDGIQIAPLDDLWKTVSRGGGRI